MPLTPERLAIVRRLVEELWRPRPLPTGERLDAMMQRANRLLGNLVHYSSGRAHENEDIVTVVVWLLDERR